MTTLRLLVAAGAAAAVAALGGGLAAQRHPAGAAGAAGAVAPAVAALPGPAAPDPSALPGGRESVPPGILSRAADARALDRAECRGTPQDDPACPPQPDPVEIDWDVRRAP